MSVVPRVAGSQAVEATISDDAGTVVAQRMLSDRSTGACVPLARAVGVWASLVIDAEVNRAKDEDERDAAVAVGESPSASEGPVGRGLGWMRDSTREPPLREPLRSVELGTMGYLRNGMLPNGGVAGLSPFVTTELAPGWVLRNALFFGRSTERSGTNAAPGPISSHLGVRSDFCRRMPGNYIERRGVEADLCAGLEGGVVTPGANKEDPMARLGLGPSVNLRGEMGGGVALELRGLVGANLLPVSSQDTPLVFASAELGVSVRFR
jgi:hypothetical protein